MIEQLDLLAQPAARRDDPVTAQLAAQSARAKNETVIRAIREYVRLYGPVSAFDIADSLHRQLGVQHDTVRTAVSRAGLTVSKMRGVSPGGRPCTLYVSRTSDLKPL